MSSEIEAMLAEVRSYNVQKTHTKSESSDELDKIVRVMFDKVDRDLNNAKNELAETKKRRVDVEKDLEEVKKQIEIEEYKETLLTKLNEACEKINSVQKL